MKPSLIQNIQAHYPGMSASHKKIAEYLLDHYDKAVFLTAKELGQTLGVSEATVIRFAMALNYKGYPELQQALQDMVKTKITTVERLRLALLDGQTNLPHKALSADISNIQLTMEEITGADFEKAVNEIILARNIYIISLRSATALGYFLHFYLQLLLQNSRLIHGVGTFFEEIRPAGPGDLVIGISFPRYTRQTVEGIKYARENGARVLAITDSLTSPLAPYSHHVLTARSQQISFVDSFAAPLSLINALILAVGARDSAKTADILRQMEAVWESYRVYHPE